MTPHTEWCVGGHRCSLGEHRADTLTIRSVGYGSALLTRVLGRNGREYAEVTLVVPLAGSEPVARAQLRRLARDLTAVIDQT